MVGSEESWLVPPFTFYVFRHLQQGQAAMVLLQIFLGLLAIGNAFSFYLPGIAPTDYEQGDGVPLLVNSLSPSWQGMSLLSYDYYFPAFKFCRPKTGPIKQAESLGSILFGDRIFNSPYELLMLKNESCKSLCSSTYDPRDIAFVYRRLLDSYVHHWLIDGLPAVYQAEHDYNYVESVPLGEVDFSDNRMFGRLFNHFDFNIQYHPTSNGKYRVVGVDVIPDSRETKPDEDGTVVCAPTKNSVIFDGENKETPIDVTFTYSVTWTYSSTPWATRWDKYLKVDDISVHWFSLVNSVVIVLFLTILVGTILVRALKKDIARYNEIDLSEEIQEDSGWKLLHGDVFRAPPKRMLLSVLVGSGSQLLMMVFVTLFFALLGFLSPSSRGSLSTVMILCYIFFGAIGGYVSARVYRVFGGESWKLNLILTPILVPSAIFGTVLLLNFFMIFKQSSGAIPFGTLLFLVVLWFTISVPLSAVGSLYAYRSPAPPAPVRTNQIPRQIPVQPTYLLLIPSFLLSGILPYEAIFIELYFVLSSLWYRRFYYMFGFLFLCFLMLLITSACVTISLVYFSLCAENYKWQWRSFLLAGASSLYIFLHSLVYLVTKLGFSGFTSNVLFIGYSLMISFVFFVLTGTVGFLSTLVFTRRIYGSIKID